MNQRSLRVAALAFLFTFAISLPASWLRASPALAEGPNAIVVVPNASDADGCREFELPRGEDNSSLAISVPFTLNFFGRTYSSLFVNDNGNVTFNQALSDWTPFEMTDAWLPIIAPFFADVHTLDGGEPVTHSRSAVSSAGYGTFAGHSTFCANWVGVGYYNRNFDKLNSFQLLLVSRDDVAVGDFDIYFNYDKVQWETGDASSGSGGFGGYPARAGFSSGDGSSTFELEGSGVPGAFLDSNTETGLVHKSRGSSQLGRYVFELRGGGVPEAPADSAAPVTRASTSPAQNATGWNNVDVAVTLTATDESGGSGVRDLTYSLSGARTTAPTTSPGSTAATTITPEGLTTVTYYATDNAGNAEAPHDLSVRIDKAAPTVSTTRTAANANGWNNSDVTVGFEAQDSLSGFANDTLKFLAEVTLASEGQGQSVSRTFLDLAGNSVSATVTGINIDRTPPTTTATPTPSANANGLWRSAVSVALAASDTLSRAARTEFKLDDVAWTPYATPVNVTGQGMHVLQYRSTDRADNQEAARTLEVGIDLTTPEAVIRFDQATRDLAVFGRDGAATLFAPISVTVSDVLGQRGDDDGEDEDRDSGERDDEDGPKGEREKTDRKTKDRTYLIEDRAGNTLAVVVRVKREGREMKASVRSLRYNGGATLTVPRNELEFEWKLSSSGALKELEQELEVGKGRSQQEVEAKFNAARNTTTIEVERPTPERRVVRPGLALLRLATDRGALTIEFD